MASIAWSFLAVLFVQYWHSAYVKSIDSTIVQTSAGTVNGFSTQVLGRKIYTFLGIPFAEPPVGQLRFQKPRPAQQWTGVRSATNTPKRCIQMKIPQSLRLPDMISTITTPVGEDCLTLNVWTPKGSVGKDVVVWIYGGGFIFGSTMPNDGTILSAFHDVVFVSVNYRLGMLGFSYFGKENVNGNMGFFDQVLALQWVKANIEAFGGNPKSVTIVGQSAGAAAVTALVISPLTRGLFTNVVSMSGVITASWATYSTHSALTITKGAARDLGCRADADEDPLQSISSSVIQCLRNLSEDRFDILGYNFTLWGPTIDGELLPDEPLNIFRSGRVNFTGNILIGDTSEDGSLVAILHLQYFHLILPTYITRSQFAAIIKAHFPKEPKRNREIIQSIYTDWARPDDGFKNTELAVNFFTDLYYICPSKMFASKLSDLGANVYFYIFAHQSNNIQPSWVGATHAADLEFWFGHRINDIIGFSESEKALSRRMMMNLANIARYGDPSLPDFFWTPFENSTERFVVLNTGNYVTEIGPRSRECAFWNYEAPRLGIGPAEPSLYREL